MSQDLPDNYHIISANKVKVPEGGQCAACLTRMDGASAIDTKERLQPKPGDMAVCCFCGALLTYEEKMVTHIATEDELALLDPRQRTALEEHSRMFKEVSKYRHLPSTVGVIIKLPHA